MGSLWKIDHKLDKRICSKNFICFLVYLYTKKIWIVWPFGPMNRKWKKFCHTFQEGHKTDLDNESKTKRRVFKCPDFLIWFDEYIGFQSEMRTVVKCLKTSIQIFKCPHICCWKICDWKEFSTKQFSNHFNE